MILFLSGVLFFAEEILQNKMHHLEVRSLPMQEQMLSLPANTLLQFLSRCILLSIKIPDQKFPEFQHQLSTQFFLRSQCAPKSAQQFYVRYACDARTFF